MVHAPPTTAVTLEPGDQGTQWLLGCCIPIPIVVELQDARRQLDRSAEVCWAGQHDVRPFSYGNAQVGLDMCSRWSGVDDAGARVGVGVPCGCYSGDFAIQMSQPDAANVGPAMASMPPSTTAPAAPAATLDAAGVPVCPNRTSVLAASAVVHVVLQFTHPLHTGHRHPSLAVARCPRCPRCPSPSLCSTRAHA